MSTQDDGPLIGKSHPLEAVIEYTNLAGETSTRVIRPFQIEWRVSRWYGGPKWILVARCLAHDKLREFPMSGIKRWR